MPYGGGNIGGPDGGPDVIWLSASPEGKEPQYSDAASGLGWIGGTDHLNPNPIFQYVVKSSTTPPPTTGEYALEVVVNGQMVGYVPITTGTTGNDAIWLVKDGQRLGYSGIIKV
jgi:hypothetical protein